MSGLDSVSVFSRKKAYLICGGRAGVCVSRYHLNTLRPSNPSPAGASWPAGLPLFAAATKTAEDNRMDEAVTKQPDIDTPRTGGWLDAALAIASGATAPQAAERASVSVRTIKRWKTRPHFKALVTQFRDEMLSAALGKLLAVNSSAVSALEKLLSDPQGSIRLGAASRILSMTLRVKEDVAIYERLTKMEDDLEKLRTDRERGALGVPGVREPGAVV